MRRLGAAVGLVMAAACAGQDPPEARPGESGSGGSTPAGSGGSTAQGSGGAPTMGAGGTGGTAPTAPGVLGFVSGSRLRANVYRGADGSQHPIGTWHDETRNEDCSFRPATDGQVRCLPDVAPHGGYYLSACQTPVVLVAVDGSCGPEQVPTYVAVPPSGSCSQVAAIHAVGAPVDPFGQFFVRTPSGCAATTLPQGRVPHAVGPEVPPADFVAATVERLAP